MKKREELEVALFTKGCSYISVGAMAFMSRFLLTQTVQVLVASRLVIGRRNFALTRSRQRLLRFRVVVLRCC